MSQEEKMSKEELQKLEDQAYFELCQILTIAMESEDIEYLNNMIATWKNKYKKLLVSSSQNFKKKIEYILNQYYSEVINSILSQIKFKETKLIENQGKAIHKLYDVLSKNKDMDTLKKEIKSWESKYPYTSFLKMYQKRIDSIKREKNLEQYAFKQEEAFRDLYYDVINKSGTIDEIKSNLHDWEEKYSINDNFSIDDFINHESEIKRYISDDYLMSISTDVSEGIRKISRSSSLSKNDISSQDKAYKSLLQITNGKKDVTKMFKWVHENSNIKFNDEYKSKILVATNFDYAPKYLKRLNHPKLNLNTSLISLDEFEHINQIKEYSILSYFNLLFNNGSITNPYFNSCVQTVYKKASKNKQKDIESSTQINNVDLKNIEEPIEEIIANSSLAQENQKQTISPSLKDPIENTNSDLTNSEIIVFSPLLFEIINKKANKAEKIQEIDEEVAEYIENYKEPTTLENTKQKL